MDTACFYIKEARHIQELRIQLETNCLVRFNHSKIMGKIEISKECGADYVIGRDNIKN